MFQKKTLIIGMATQTHFTWTIPASTTASNPLLIAASKIV
jgi:hypothetical protein